MNKSKTGLVAFILIMVVAVVGMVGSALAQPGRHLAADEIEVYYNNDGTKMPIVIDGVTELRVYTLHGELFQLAIYVPYRERAFVFTQVELDGYQLPVAPGYPVEEFIDKMHHTYDPMISDVKLELNKAYIAEQYQKWYGRERIQSELDHGLYKLFQKVQRIDYEWRLANHPEAILYGISQQRGAPATGEDETQVRAMLETGAEREEIIAALA